MSECLNNQVRFAHLAQFTPKAEDRVTLLEDQVKLLMMILVGRLLEEGSQLGDDESLSTMKG